SEPETSKTVSMAKPMASSHEIICAEARMAPSKAYLELDAQPATITPYTPSDVTAMMYSRPALTLESTSSGLKGITAQAASAGISVTTGASKNSTLFDWAGISS